MQQVSLSKSEREVCYWVTFLSTLLFMLTPVYCAAVGRTEVTPVYEGYWFNPGPWSDPLNPTCVLRLIVTLNQLVAPSLKPGLFRRL